MSSSQAFMLKYNSSYKILSAHPWSMSVCHAEGLRHVSSPWLFSLRNTKCALHAHHAPVLSDRMVCTMPSSSLRLDVRADGGVSVSAWYMRRSLLINRNACMRTA